MDFHVYDTRLIRKYARFLELAYAENKAKLPGDKQALLQDTIERMREEIFDVFGRNDEGFWNRTYNMALDLLAQERRGRENAAAARRERQARLQQQREEAHALLDMMNA